MTVNGADIGIPACLRIDVTDDVALEHNFIRLSGTQGASGVRKARPASKVS